MNLNTNYQNRFFIAFGFLFFLVNFIIFSKHLHINAASQKNYSDATVNTDFEETLEDELEDDAINNDSDEGMMKLESINNYMKNRAIKNISLHNKNIESRKNLGYNSKQSSLLALNLNSDPRKNNSGISNIIIDNNKKAPSNNSFSGFGNSYNNSYQQNSNNTPSWEESSNASYSDILDSEIDAELEALLASLS